MSTMGKVNRPTLPWDSKQIRAYREQCQKGREREDVWSWYVLRRISMYLSVFCHKFNVAPNAVSWFSIAFMLVAGYCLVLATPVAFALAFLFYNLGYLCDCVDGEIARLKKTTSNRGYFLDICIQGCSIPLFSSIGVAFVQLLSGHALNGGDASLAYVVIVAAAMSLLIPLAYQLTSSKAAETDPLHEMRVKSNVWEWVAFLTGLPGFFFITFLLNLSVMIFNLPFSANTAFFAAFLAIFFAKTLARLIVTLANLRD